MATRNAPKRPALPVVNYSFTAQIDTRFSDEDNQKILNHATYMPLMEEARFLYLVAAGAVSREQDMPFVQHSTYVRFVAPGRAPASTLVDVATIHIGRTSFTQSYRVREKETGATWVESIQTLVMWDGEFFKSREMQAGFRERLALFDEKQNLDAKQPMPSNPDLHALTDVHPHPGPFRFQIPLKTRWVDEDRHGSLSGNVFWTLMEDGRAMYFGKKGLDLMSKGNAFPFVLLSSALRYFRPGHGIPHSLDILF